jgi:Ni/Co efflux regulator RcnB
MKHIVTAAFAATIALASVSAAFAQPRDNRDYHDNREYHGNRDNHGYQSHDDHGYRRHADWKRGHRLAHDDWARGQHVDYRSHHLRAPPRGYEWREVDGNYVMAAVATGLIASIIAGSH